jgi:hypothetical protein
VVAAVLVAGCTGYTTEATNIGEQTDGSYSAQLNFVVSCGSGEQCSWYVHYRPVGTSTWTNVPATPHGPVAGPVSDVSLSENVTGLTAGAQYEYQVCGSFQPGQQFICVGPDDQTNTTTKFTTAAWSLQTTPTPSGAVVSELFGVSCTSATACSAVGDYTNSINGTGTYWGLAERWDGSTWTIQSTPSGGGSLSAVSCTSATACTAVGMFGLAERWDGSTWTIQSTPSGGSSLNGVSCTSATECIAVGSNSTYSALAEHWDGSTWTIQPTPGGGILNGVSCTSATACIAVGSGGLAERWDGSTWTILTTPTPSGATGVNLSGVSCTSATACITVGTVSSGYFLGTLAESWDGSTWTIQTTPTPSGSATLSSLWGVSCTSATACTALGDYSTSSSTSVLAERWDGRTWTIQSTPSGLAQLDGVSCTSAAACTAVGRNYINSNGIIKVTLAERYSG